jgi:hypothetical protein
MKPITSPHNLNKSRNHNNKNNNNSEDRRQEDKHGDDIKELSATLGAALCTEEFASHQE